MSFDPAAVNDIEARANDRVARATTVEELRSAQADVLGKRGELTALNATVGTLDPAERKKAYEQLAAIVLVDRPIIYLYHRHWLWGYTAKLSGLRTVPDGLVRVQGLKFN